MQNVKTYKENIKHITHDINSKKYVQHKQHIISHNKHTHRKRNMLQNTTYIIDITHIISHDMNKNKNITHHMAY